MRNIKTKITKFLLLTFVVVSIFLISCNNSNISNNNSNINNVNFDNNNSNNHSNNKNYEGYENDNQGDNMKLTSTAFQENTKIPSKYTCDSDNVNPPLKLERIPENTKSWVLIMDDPDIPDFVKEKFNIEKWDHWVVWNIPPQQMSINENEEPNGVLGKNSGGNLGYAGPCPPDREHRYIFKAYALDTKLDLPEGSSKQQVIDAMQGHIIEETELIGLYERNQ